MAHYNPHPLPPLSTLTRFHKEISASHFELSHVLLCLLGRKSLPRPLQRANQKRDRQEKNNTKTEGYEFPIDVAGFFLFIT